MDPNVEFKVNGNPFTTMVHNKHKPFHKLYFDWVHQNYINKDPDYNRVQIKSSNDEFNFSK